MISGFAVDFKEILEYVSHEMAQLPQCPNHREKRCERSELILVGEDERYFKFHCKCCKLFWVWSKPKQRAEAAELNRIKKLSELSQREQAAVRFYAPAKGWVTS